MLCMTNSTLLDWKITQREWTMGNIRHSTGDFRLCRNRGRGRAAITHLNGGRSTKQACHARLLAELPNAEEIERGGHDGDQ